jgi:hypothetical protein
MNPAMELLRVAANGPRALDTFLQTHELSPQLATGVRELFVRFVETDQFDNAEFAASVLSTLWLKLGNLHEVVRNLLDFLQLRFKLAESAGEYAEVRTRTLDALRKAAELPDDEFAFRAAVLAADASFFGYLAGGQAFGLDATRVLADLVAATHRVKRATTSTWLPRFVSLLAGALQEFLSESLPAEQQVQADRSFRELAGGIPTLFPTISHFPDAPAKAAQVDALFKSFADKYIR